VRRPDPFDERARNRMRGGIAGAFAVFVAALAMLLFGAWWAGAIFYAYGNDGIVSARTLAIAHAVFVLACVVAFLFRGRRRVAFLAYLLELLLVLGWYATIKPSNDRDWQTDVAVLPYATIEGDLVTVHNIRNFTYRTETDYTPGYYDKTFDLGELDSADLITSYWMGPQIAHVFVSFGFGGKDFLAVSIETRKEKGEEYSTLAGFFRQYELYYVVADERDVIKLRTNYRKNPPEEVYVYRTRAPRENVRRLFLDYIRSINSLKDQPEFYNTMTTNCTTTIFMHTRVNPGHAPLSWKVLASGYVPQYAYESGRIDTSMPFEELRRRALVNPAAQAADDAPDFSQRIRVGLPIPEPLPASAQ
jgi:hypothetical protein